VSVAVLSWGIAMMAARETQQASGIEPGVVGRRSMGRVGGSVFCAVVVSVMLAACATASSAAPPVVVCGETLYPEEPAGLPLNGAPGPLPSHLPVFPGVFDGTLLRLTTSCEHGMNVSISPPGIVKIHKAVRSADGSIVAVWLVATAKSGRATLTATAPDGTTTRIVLHVR
jgi:hypothetical protein